MDSSGSRKSSSISARFQFGLSDKPPTSDIFQLRSEIAYVSFFATVTSTTTAFLQISAASIFSSYLVWGKAAEKVEKRNGIRLSRVLLITRRWLTRGRGATSSAHGEQEIEKWGELAGWRARSVLCQEPRKSHGARGSTMIIKLFSTYPI